MTVVVFLVLGLATWRVSSLFSKEAGLFDVFKRIRELAGIQHDTDGNVWMIPHKFFAELLSCVWCISIWAGTFWAIVWYLAPAPAFFIALPFSLSAMAILVEKFS